MAGEGWGWRGFRGRKGREMGLWWGIFRDRLRWIKPENKNFGIFRSDWEKRGASSGFEDVGMRVRVFSFNADGQILRCRCSAPASSVVEEFREFILSRRIGVEDESAFGVEGALRCVPGGCGFGGIRGVLPVLEFEIRRPMRCLEFELGGIGEDQTGGWRPETGGVNEWTQ